MMDPIELADLAREVSDKAALIVAGKASPIDRTRMTEGAELHGEVVGRRLGMLEDDSR